MASCGFLPEFAPVEINGRLLGDGGLSANATIEALHLSEDMIGMNCFVIDLYARDGEGPHDLETAMSRKNDLIFSNQTWQRLAAYRRELELRLRIPPALNKAKPSPDTTILYLSYRPRREEAGAERGSERMLNRRWRAGESDMREALACCNTDRNDPGELRVTLRAIRQSAVGNDLALVG